MPPKTLLSIVKSPRVGKQMLHILQNREKRIQGTSQDYNNTWWKGTHDVRACAAHLNFLASGWELTAETS